VDFPSYFLISIYILSKIDGFHPQNEPYISGHFGVGGRQDACLHLHFSDSTKISKMSYLAGEIDGILVQLYGENL